MNHFVGNKAKLSSLLMRALFSAAAALYVFSNNGRGCNTFQRWLTCRCFDVESVELVDVVCGVGNKLSENSHFEWLELDGFKGF
ncbi:hypothetical protein AVEN_118584-1 [Araneus ventricosus]|uniref:Uncharacterized protein n=1 Tax=Araneus ventricosus TaxID=182803 RepID=A0A4Y2AWE2_ARAVE|nr:hypothetical protein AVEN_118584-1 [Araneus ventricosus]